VKITHQPATGKIVCLIAFSPVTLFSKIENIKVKVKYGFVLHTGLSFEI
jgi:hypothetical protein